MVKSALGGLNNCLILFWVPRLEETELDKGIGQQPGLSCERTS